MSQRPTSTIPTQRAIALTLVIVGALLVFLIIGFWQDSYLGAWLAPLGFLAGVIGFLWFAVLRMFFSA